MRIILCLIALSLSLASYALAKGGCEIVLTDGTTIYGEIVAVENDIYTVKSAKAGTLTLKAAMLPVASA